MAEENNNSTGGYRRFSPKAALELAAPPTWAAAIMSVAVGGAAAIALSPGVPPVFGLRAVVVWVLMLVTAILMQSAVNTLNDYKDFLHGTDTADTILDEHDASIVYNHINPKAALYFSIALLAAAAVTGGVVVFLSDWPLLVIGVVAALIVVIYSVGPRPISFLPLGEAVSGITMGGFITVSTYYAMTLAFTPYVVFIAIPPIITIALIMQTNNTCDIERDIESGRKTLPILLGRNTSVQLARLLSWGTLAFMILCIVMLDIILWRSMIVLAAIAVFAVLLYLVLRHRIWRIADGSYSLRNRRQMMGNIVGFCYLLNLMWCVMLLTCWGLGEVLGVF
jgi:1,4-dihydroxy-2-naphthoate octaprenyltransferase